MRELLEASVSDPSLLPPVARTVGMRLVAVSDGAATWELEVDPERHANPMGILHGGVLCDLVDAAMGVAYASLLGDGESFTTLELKVNFLRATRDGLLRAHGRVVRAGRTVGLVEADVVDEQERLVARASSTCLTLRPGA